jgi:hypothetical protein
VESVCVKILLPHHLLGHFAHPIFASMVWLESRGPSYSVNRAYTRAACRSCQRQSVSKVGRRSQIGRPSNLNGACEREEALQGVTGCKGACSGIGPSHSSAVLPYTVELPALKIRVPFAPRSLTASSILSVPSTFTCIVRYGDDVEIPAKVCEASGTCLRPFFGANQGRKHAPLRL